MRRMTKMDGEAMKSAVTIMDKDFRERLEEQRAGYEAVPRRVYLQRGDFEKHGYTQRCPGCVSILKGTTRQAHSEACRRRMEDLMKDTDKAKQAEKRRDV